jgi:hypothetical protein
LFTVDPRKRKRLRDIPLDHVTRVIPVLVVQDNILRGPFINWWLNRKFDSLIDRTQLRCEVKVDSLNLVNIHELEIMAESAEAGSFDFLYGLQLRCHADPEMRSALHDFLLNVPGYGEGKSKRIDKILADQWKEMEEYVFGAEAVGVGRESAERERILKIFSGKALRAIQAKDARAFAAALREASLSENSPEWKRAWEFFRSSCA